MSSYSGLLEIRSLEKVTLEFTTRCNLKCGYCAVTRPWHQKNDLDLSGFDSLVEEMKTLGVKKVQISGGGETTIVKDWDRYLALLLDNGFEVTIISNLAKPMTDAAIRSLSLCSEVTTSCDTAVPEMYEAIRKGGEFKTFVHNIVRIRAQCALEGRKPPYLIWNAVACDKMIFDVDRWVAFGISLGVDHFQISEMAKYDDLPGYVPLIPIGLLDDPDLERARESVARAREVAQRAGKWFAVLPAVEEALAGSHKILRAEVKVDASGAKPKAESVRTFVQLNGNEAAATNKNTRNCLLPWTEAFIWASNGIAPCCMYKKIADYPAPSVRQQLNSANFVKIREGLLSGSPEPMCQACPMFDWVDVDELRQTVSSRFAVPTTA